MVRAASLESCLPTWSELDLMFAVHCNNTSPHHSRFTRHNSTNSPNSNNSYIVIIVITVIIVIIVMIATIVIIVIIIIFGSGPAVELGGFEAGGQDLGGQLVLQQTM